MAGEFPYVTQGCDMRTDARLLPLDRRGRTLARWPAVLLCVLFLSALQPVFAQQNPPKPVEPVQPIQPIQPIQPAGTPAPKPAGGDFFGAGVGSNTGTAVGAAPAGGAVPGIPQ